MNLKLLLTIWGWVGIPSLLLSVVWDIAQWKTTVMFIIGALWAIVKLIGYCWKTWQIVRMNELNIKKKKKELDRDIFS